jgi:prenylcysteine oxidase / farnesylcysteine lyase
MYNSGWNLVFALIFALLCGQTRGIWPFSSVHAAADAQDTVYLDANARRIAVIGMSTISSIHLTRSLTLEPFSMSRDYFRRVSFSLPT